MVEDLGYRHTRVNECNRWSAGLKPSFATPMQEREFGHGCSLKTGGHTSLNNGNEQSGRRPTPYSDVNHNSSTLADRHRDLLAPKMTLSHTHAYDAHDPFPARQSRRPPQPTQPEVKSAPSMEV